MSYYIKISSFLYRGTLNMKTLIFLGIMVGTVAALDGDNVCPEMERFTVNVTQFVLRKVTIRNYKWCVSVPPRCSYYTEEQRYVPEVVEKEEIRATNKCCPGFTEDKTTRTCISNCSNCKNGECDLNNECVCQAGFWGTSCEKICNDLRWGINCEHKCSCTKGDCSPITGYCNCPPGWKGSSCEEIDVVLLKTPTNGETTPTSSIGQKSSVEINDLLKQLTKYTDRAHYPTFQKYFTFLITTLKPSTKLEYDTNLEDEYLFTRSTTATSASSTSEGQTLIEGLVSPESILTGQVKAEVNRTTVTANRSTPTESSTKQASLTNATTDLVMSVTQFPNVIMKEKVMEAIEVSVTGTQTVSSNGPWFNYQSPGDLEINLTTHQNEMHVNNSHIIFSIGAVAGILATIILIVAVTILTTQNYVRNKTASNSIIAVARNTDKDTDGGISSVSIYTRSVFHTPLPEPPTFHNSIFTTPLENNCSNGGALETKVVCNMNHLSNRTNSHIVDEFYDHPPSTGSYRAASIPEPSEKSLPLITSASKEHLYDEIPCWKQPMPLAEFASSFYANTIPKKI